MNDALSNGYEIKTITGEIATSKEHLAGGGQGCARCS